MTLTDVINELADLVAARAAIGRNFGLVVIPEGLVHAIPELHALIAEMNAIFAGARSMSYASAAVASHSHVGLLLSQRVCPRTLFLPASRRGLRRCSPFCRRSSVRNSSLSAKALVLSNSARSLPNASLQTLLGRS